MLKLWNNLWPWYKKLCCCSLKGLFFGILNQRSTISVIFVIYVSKDGIQRMLGITEMKLLQGPCKNYMSVVDLILPMLQTSCCAGLHGNLGLDTNKTSLTSLAQQCLRCQKSCNAAQPLGSTIAQILASA